MYYHHMSFQGAFVGIWVNFPRTGKMVNAHLEPELELFEVWEIMVPQIIITIITHVINFKHL